MLLALSASAAGQRTLPLHSPKPRIEWSAYGLDNYWHEAPQINGEDISFVFPQAARGNYVSMLTKSSSTPADLRGQSLWMVFDMAVTGGIPAFNYGWEGTPENVSDVPASMRFFVSDLPTPYDLATSTQQPQHYWFYNPGIAVVNALDFTHEMPYGASLSDYANWTDGEGHSAADPAYRALFLNCIAITRQYGVAFGGGRYFDVGIGTSSVFGEPYVTFILKTFQVYTPRSKR